MCSFIMSIQNFSARELEKGLLTYLEKCTRLSPEIQGDAFEVKTHHNVKNINTNRKVINFKKQP